MSKRVVTVELHITPEEESMADALYIDFKDSVSLTDERLADELTFQGYLSILLKNAIAQQTRERCPDGEEDDQ